MDEIEDKKKGRAAMLEMYRAANPESGEEIEDDVLFDFADGRHREMSEKYETLNGANRKLAERVTADPRTGLMLNLLADGKSVPYATAKLYGKEWIDNDLEEFEKGYQEHLTMLAQSEVDRETAAKNIEESLSRITEYAKTNELDEEKSDALVRAIEAVAINLIMGIVPDEFIDFTYKGLNYDADVEKAAETGFVEGKNATIDMKKKKAAAPAIPDLAATTAPVPAQTERWRYRSIADEFKD